MKRLFIVALLLVTTICSAQSTDIAIENVIFFYNATLTDNKDVTCKGFDMDFHINTYDILQSNGIIDSMFVRTNEKQLENIDNRNWTYKCEFNITKQQLKKDLINLNIQNLDGNCSIYINNKFVKKYNNSFVDYCDNVKKFLKKGKNTIELRFTPKDSIRMNQRSPQYLYGWDWYPKTLAPRINAIYLTCEDDEPCVDYANIQTKDITLNSDSTYSGEMLLNVHFRKPLKEKLTLRLSKYDSIAYIDNTIGEDEVFTLEPNNSGYYSFGFTINNARLWYPNLMGEQNLYSANLSVENKSDSFSQRTILFGIRTIELVRDKDSIGESFYFKINGKEFFAKGANYIMTYADPEKDVAMASSANMNMLRIWGGSDYGSDDFFNLCDRYGILVWQDYPFACEIYPTDEAFINNVKQEATQNLMRISTHPSLALICGNNEIWEGWNHWGWKDLVKDTVQAVKDYEYLFKEVLGGIAKQYVPTIDYIHSSPVNHGWGSERSRTHGDCHYWGVWWADSNFETYTHKIPRFASEYGFQGAMNPETAEKYCSHPYTKDNEDFAIHQKHPRGFELIDNRIKEWFGDYKDDDQYILYSQLTQQEALKIAVEAHRQHKPYCMGSLFWQFNDPYPSIAWGCIEANGEPKPEYYTAQKVFQPVIFAIDKTCPDSIKIYACSDLATDTVLTFKLKIQNQNDAINYLHISEKKPLKAQQTTLLTSIAYKDIKNFDATKDYLWVEGFYGDEFISNYTFFCYPKDYIDFTKYLEVLDEYYFPEEDD